MEDCIFCKIVKRIEPGYFVYEDDSIVGFLDNHPLNLGHTLVVPKLHYNTIFDIPNDLLMELIVTTKNIGMKVCGALDAAGFNLFQNNGTHAGQVVPHIHFHIIPRFENDPIRFRPVRKPAQKESLEEIMEKILSFSDGTK